MRLEPDFFYFLFFFLKILNFKEKMHEFLSVSNMNSDLLHSIAFFFAS